MKRVVVDVPAMLKAARKLPQGIARLNSVQLHARLAQVKAMLSTARQIFPPQPSLVSHLTAADTQVRAQLGRQLKHEQRWMAAQARQRRPVVQVQRKRGFVG